MVARRRRRSSGGRRRDAKKNNRRARALAALKCLLVSNTPSCRAVPGEIQKIRSTATTRARNGGGGLRAHSGRDIEGHSVYGRSFILDERGIFKKKKKTQRITVGGNCRRGNQKSGFTCSEIFIISLLFRGSLCSCVCVYKHIHTDINVAVFCARARVCACNNKHVYTRYIVYINRCCFIVNPPKQTGFHFSQLALKYTRTTTAPEAVTIITKRNVYT